MRDLLRSLTQTDSDEIPDTLADHFLETAWQHCSAWKANWPFYRKTWTYTFAGDASTDSFTLWELVDDGSDSDADVALPAMPNSIEQVFDVTNNRRLLYMDIADYRRVRYGTDLGRTGDATHWSFEGGEYTNSGLTNVGWDVAAKFYLWPLPATSVTLRIEGWRQPISFVTLNEGASGTPAGGYYSATAANAVPDMPAPFHEAILNYAIGQAFVYLDEGDRALFYIQLCDNKLALLEDQWFRAVPSDGPIVMNGKPRWTTALPERLRYDFE